MPIIRTDKVLRPRDKSDFYPTPAALVSAAVSIPEVENSLKSNMTVLDPGAGYGVWGEVLYHKMYPYVPRLTGVEIYAGRWNKHYKYWFRESFTCFNPGVEYDMVIGNPPYRNAEAFVRCAFSMLKPGGRVVYLLRTAFLEGASRAKSFYPNYPLESVYVLAQRPSFTGNGKTDATSYSVFVWKKNYTGVTALKWLNWR